MHPSVAGGKRGVALPSARFLVNCAHGDAPLGGWKCQIGDFHLRFHLIVEVLDLPLLSGGGRQKQSTTQKKEFHYPRGAMTRSITLIARSLAGSTTASAAKHPTCSPTVVNSSI